MSDIGRWCDDVIEYRTVGYKVVYDGESHVYMNTILLQLIHSYCTSMACKNVDVCEIIIIDVLFC